MSDDLQDELSGLGERERADRRAREALVAAWRRLRALRDGLAREIEARTAGMTVRETDPSAILAALRGAREARIEAARREAGEAEARLAAHLASGGPLAVLSSAWRSERARLAAEAAAARGAALSLAADLRDGCGGLEARARATAADNHRANERDARPLAPQRERLAALDLALAALEAGDGPSAACLARWDLPMLVRIARIRKRLDEDGFVSDEDYIFYRSAVRPRADEAQGTAQAAMRDGSSGTVLIRRTVEEIVVMPPGGPGRPGGSVVDAEWEEVRPDRREDPRPGVPRATLPPPGDWRMSDR